jgi:hypothetical protein
VCLRGVHAALESRLQGDRATTHPTKETILLNVRVTTSATTVFVTLSYLLCVAYGLLIPSSANMHQLLQIVLPGFVWISTGAFLLGLAWAVAWGVYLGGGFVLTYNMLHRWIASKAT